jgi:hypothetical protein
MHNINVKFSFPLSCPTAICFSELRPGSLRDAGAKGMQTLRQFPAFVSAVDSYWNISTNSAEFSNMNFMTMLWIPDLLHVEIWTHRQMYGRLNINTRIEASLLHFFAKAPKTIERAFVTFSFIYSVVSLVHEISY